jgi:hypothetical protein
VRANKFVWLGTSKVFDAFTFAFEETEHGWIWAHAYRFAPDCSTFIVECSEEVWRRLGFDRMAQADAIAACERIFARISTAIRCSRTRRIWSARRHGSTSAASSASGGAAAT